MLHTISLQEIESFPSGVLRLTEEVSVLIRDIRTGSAELKASSIPLFFPRIEFLKKKLEKKKSEAESMIDRIRADDRFKNDSDTATAAIRQQLVIINNDIKLLNEVHASLKDAGNKLKEVKLL
ncbi:MAG: hypothetical protein K6G27_05835 [Lachnospiraceae bacterium]|nr:hypothetical protein [Lachnospiraceae bacterium]